MSKFMLMTRQYVSMSPQVEQDYNNWYWTEHIPVKSTIPGVLSARRYHLVGNSRLDAPQYMAIYEIDKPEVIESYDWKVTTVGSEWSKRLNLHFEGAAGVYERIFPTNVDDSQMYPKSEFVYVTRMTPLPSGEDEFNRWYNEHHVPEMTAVPGVISGRRYRSVGKAYPYGPKYTAIYEIESPDVIESEAWNKAGHNQLAEDTLKRTRIMKSFPGTYQLMRSPKKG